MSELSRHPTETQRLIRDSARQFAQKVLAPRAAQLDQEGGFPAQSMQEAADLGLLAINVDPELGGVGAGALAYSMAVVELAQGCAATTVGICVSNMVAEVVAAFGTTEQKERFVPGLCDGSLVVGGFALSEAGAGSDPAGMRCTATRSEKGWRLNGSKLWITSGTHAGLFVVWAKTSDAPGARGITAFLVPGDSPGLVRGKPEHKMGQRGSPTTALEFHDVELGPDALLGEVDKGFAVAMMALDGGRVGIASLALGVGRAALAYAARYAQEREQFGKSISDFQAIQWMIADSATELEAAELLARRAAWRKDQGLPFAREAAMAKLFASERSFGVCNRALQILGGYGYTQEFPVERYLRDVRVTSIYEGTSEIQRVVLSRAIAKRFASQA